MEALKNLNVLIKQFTLPCVRHCSQGKIGPRPKLSWLLRLDGKSAFPNKHPRKNNVLIYVIKQFFCEYQKVNVKEAHDMRTIIVAVKF